MSFVQIAMETEELLSYAEQNKDTLDNAKLRELANTLHSRMRVTPPDQWKRIQAIEDHIRNKIPNAFHS